VFPRALDGAFLDLDTRDAPLHVGWTIRLEGSPPSLGALRRHLAARLDRVPRLRQRLVATALAGRARRWEDDPAFDVARHVTACWLPAPGGPGELRAAAGTLLSAPLDPARPLWHVYLVGGLAGKPPGDPPPGGHYDPPMSHGRRAAVRHPTAWALLGQVHHVLVDGIAAVEVAALLLDADPDAPPDPPSSWTPRRLSPLGAAGLAARSRLGAAAGAARALTMPGPGSAAEASGALRELLRPAPVTSLDAGRGPRRTVAYADAGLGAVREAGRARGATVNDVLLAASSVALGAALRRRGEAHDELKALVPVSVRAEPSQLGNRLSFVVVSLPVAARDAPAALDRIVVQTRRAKGSQGATSVAGLAEALELLPPAGRSLTVRAALRLASFNVIVSNVPGPELPLYLMGRRVTAIHPAVPVVERHGLTIGALSYAGRLGIGLYANAAAVPDAVEIGRDLESAMDALRVRASPRDASAPPAGRSR
jgi:WS/DGAT/MGAT family acyltransferase